VARAAVSGASRKELGLVWDRENGEMPAEWANLSVEPPLPEKSLFAGKCVVQDLEAVPPADCRATRRTAARGVDSIERNGQLKGVILAGSRGKQAFVPWTGMQSVAAELALAIGLEEERGIAAIRNVDFARGPEYPRSAPHQESGRDDARKAGG